MSEMEQLKKNTETQRMTGIVEELNIYLEKLFADMDSHSLVWQKNSIVEMILFAIWILALFIAPNIEQFIWFGWLLAVARNWMFIQPKTKRTLGEIEGCIKTLEILGYMDKGKKKKMKKYKESIIAKIWAKVKSKKRKEAFA